MRAHGAGRRAGRARGRGSKAASASHSAGRPIGGPVGRLLRMQVYNAVGNHAAFGGDALDATKADGEQQPPAASDREEPHFAGMSAAQRYELDNFGFLRLPQVLSPAELAAAQAAFDRTQAERPLPGPMEQFPLVAETDTEALAYHPKLLPVLLELCGGAPHLVHGGFIATEPAAFHTQSPEHKPPNSGQLHCQREYDCQHASYAAEAPGRCRCDNMVVFPYLDTCETGEGGLLVQPGSHKSQFSRPRTLFYPYGRHEEEWAAKDWAKSSAASPQHDPLWHDVPEGLVNLCPAAGDYILMPESTCHGIMPWRNSLRGRRVLALRFKSGEAYATHCAHYADHPEPQILARMSPPMKALVHGDTAALRAMVGADFRPPSDPGPTPPPAKQRRWWRVGHGPDGERENQDCREPFPELAQYKLVANDAVYSQGVRDRCHDLDTGNKENSPWGPVEAATTAAAGSASVGDATPTAEIQSSSTKGADSVHVGMTPEQRYLMDVQGYFILRGVLSPTELAAARAAFERVRTTPIPEEERRVAARSNIEGKPIREPDLEALATHPKLLPILYELGEGAPHLTALTMIYHPPHVGPPLTCEPYGQLHSHRESRPPGNKICYEVREPGRVITDDLNVFPYFDSVFPGDGGVAMVPGSVGLSLFLSRLYLDTDGSLLLALSLPTYLHELSLLCRCVAYLAELIAAQVEVLQTAITILALFELRREPSLSEP